jgi:hypothetical protein
MTGKPMPMDAQQRMQMAPEVFQFTRNFAKKPNILEKTGNLIKNIGKTTLMGAAGLAAAPAFVEQQETTADSYAQDRVENQTASNTILRSGTQQVDLENNKTIAEDVVETQSLTPDTPVDARIIERADDLAKSTGGFDATPKKSEEQILSEMKQYEEQAGLNRIGGPANVSDKVEEFLKQGKINPVLLAAMQNRGQEEELVGTSFPIASQMTDNPQIALDGGQSTRAQSREFIKETEPIGGIPTNVDPSTLTPEVKNVLSNIAQGMATIPLEKQIDAAKKIVDSRSPNEVFGKESKDRDLITAVKEGIPIKDREAAKQRVDEKTAKKQKELGIKSSLTEKVDDFTSRIMPNTSSSFVESMSLDVSADKTPSATFNLNQKDGGTKPYSVELSTPMAVSLNEMVQDGSIKDESFGKLFNLAKKSIKDKSGMAFGIDQ